jgi:formin 2
MGARAQVRPSSQQRRRLKQLHWDKLREATAGTVWARNGAASPNLDFDELENLFQVR